MQFSLEKVVTDSKGISTVFNVTDITLSNCQTNPIKGTN
jgi:hypothetical protein